MYDSYRILVAVAIASCTSLHAGNHRYSAAAAAALAAAAVHLNTLIIFEAPLQLWLY